jgi:hypothetical protein
MVVLNQAGIKRQIYYDPGYISLLKLASASRAGKCKKTLLC